MKHLIFFDGKCGLCDRLVQFLIKRDNKNLFVFAPLQGKTAAAELKSLPEEFKTIDSVILIENYSTDQQQIYVLSKGALRVCWLLGGKWILIGWLSFLPSFLFDWIYRIVAKNRHRLFPQDVCQLPDPNTKERFLP